MGRCATHVALGLLVLFLSAPAAAQDDSTLAPPSEGDVIPFDEAARLKPYLPRELWPHRDFLFYEGMQLEIGPPHRDYSPPEVYRE